MARDRSLTLKLRALDRMSSVVNRIQKTFPKLSRSIRRASRATQIFNARTKALRRNLQKIGGGLKRFGTGMAIGVTAPILLAGAAGVKLFATFQQGLRGVEKTTGLTRVEVAKLGAVFDQLSTEIPVSTAEMLELAQAGGQLGIKGAANIEKFTVVMAKLGRASDVTGEEGAKSIARILTVTNTGIGDIDRFAAALVDLGNNAAAGEREILEVATRVAGQIGRFDVASDKVLGIATALKALGKRAESAGSVVGRTFDAIDQSLKKGGNAALLLSKLTGVSVDQLKVQFEKDAAGVFQKFIVGLSKVQKGGGNLIKVMGALGLQGVRINDILGTLSKNPEVLAENMDRATKAFKDNVALEKEFAVQTDSLASEFKLLANTFTSVLRLVGKDLVPVVRFFGKILKDIFNFLRNNPTIRTLVIVLASLAAVMGPILFVMGAFLVILPAISAGLIALGVAGAPVILTILAITAGIIALTVASVFIVKEWDRIKQFFTENPFGRLLSTIVSFFSPLVKLVRLFQLVFSSATKLKGINAGTVLPNLAKDTFGKALGPAKGVSADNRRAAQAPGEAVNGQIGITFRNAPPGTNIKAKTEGPLDFNLGFSGGIL